MKIVNAIIGNEEGLKYSTIEQMWEYYKDRWFTRTRKNVGCLRAEWYEKLFETDPFI